VYFVVGDKATLSRDSALSKSTDQQSHSRKQARDSVEKEGGSLAAFSEQDQEALVAIRSMFRESVEKVAVFFCGWIC
jgi:hypothetical protein